MTVLKELDDLLQRGGITGVFLGPSVVSGYARFCTITGTDGRSLIPEGSGRGRTSEEALQNAIRAIRPVRKMPGMR